MSRDGVLGLGASQIPETARLFQGSELCRARALLALTAAPSSLPCREAEREAIARFVREAVAAGEKPALPPCVGVPDDKVRRYLVYHQYWTLNLMEKPALLPCVWVPNDKVRRYLVYRKYWTLNPMPLVVYP